MTNHAVRNILFARLFLAVLLAALLCACGGRGITGEAGCTKGIPDYGRRENWAFFMAGEDKPVDLFIIAPTVHLGKDGAMNAAPDDADYRGSTVGALRMQIGIYAEHCRVFSPYYRQATLAVYGLEEHRRQLYMNIAYADIRAAFMSHARDFPDRPLVLAGFYQGAELALRLLMEFFDEPSYQDRLVAAYIIGWRVTPEDVWRFPHLKMAKGEEDTGVIVSFNSESEHISSSLFVPACRKTYGINPLTWKADCTLGDKRLNKGACFTDYTGIVKREIPALTGARIDPRRGTLKLPDISEKQYPGVLFEDGVYHIYDYQFFYRNLQENVGKRIAAWLKNRKLRAED